jgi:hypothetical protein
MGILLIQIAFSIFLLALSFAIAGVVWKYILND